MKLDVLRWKHIVHGHVLHPCRRKNELPQQRLLDEHLQLPRRHPSVFLLRLVYRQLCRMLCCKALQQQVKTHRVSSTSRSLNYRVIRIPRKNKRKVRIQTFHPHTSHLQHSLPPQGNLLLFPTRVYALKYRVEQYSNITTFRNESNL